MCCALPFFCAAAVTTLCCASDGAVRYYHCRGAADDRLMVALSLLVLCPPVASLSLRLPWRSDLVAGAVRGCKWVGRLRF